MEVPFPKDWTENENPPYTYYMYYLYHNIKVLNCFRHERELNTFNLRPQCGEAGSIQHLVAAFMMADSITDGTTLTTSPVLQYLFYLCQISITVSPVCNSALPLDYNKLPSPDFLAHGLRVSLSTNTPLRFYFTKEPLMNEYSILARKFK